jgi:hypothetical protein
MPGLPKVPSAEKIVGETSARVRRLKEERIVPTLSDTRKMQISRGRPEQN